MKLYYITYNVFVEDCWDCNNSGCASCTEVHKNPFDHDSLWPGEFEAIQSAFHDGEIVTTNKDGVNWGKGIQRNWHKEGGGFMSHKK